MNHEPLYESYELTLMDLSLLKAKIIFDEKTEKWTCSIGNSDYKYKIKPGITNSKARLRIIMKHKLFLYLLKDKKIRYCDCGTLILDNRKYVDICNDCLNNIPINQRPWRIKNV